MRAVTAPAFLATVGIGIAVACSNSPPDSAVPCTGGFLGDASKPAELELLLVNAAYVAVALHDGDKVPMLVPPQGGEVLFVGVRATNIDSCGLELTGALRDETSQQVRFDKRPVNLFPTRDGWGVTGPIGMSVSGTVSNFSNIPICTNQWSTTDVYDHEYGLEVTIKDRGGRTVEKKIHVTPTCGEPAHLSHCRCICRQGYVLGSNCPAGDGGPDAGVADDGGGPP